MGHGTYGARSTFPEHHYFFRHEVAEFIRKPKYIALVAVDGDIPDESCKPDVVIPEDNGWTPPKAGTWLLDWKSGGCGLAPHVLANIRMKQVQTLRLLIVLMWLICSLIGQYLNLPK